MIENIKTLFRYRVLIQSLVSRELKARYRGSVLGFLWSLLNPLLLLLIYSFVFSVIFTPPRAEGNTPYALFLFCGLLPWIWFSSSLLESSNILASNANLIKKVLFPADVLPCVSVFTNMVHFFLALPILFAFLIIYKKPITVYWFLFPLIVLAQLVFTFALSLLISSLAVHFKDIKDIIANLVTFWFFATPIIYGLDWIPERFRWVLSLNPMTHIIVSYQKTLFTGELLPWRRLSVTFLLSVLLLFIGNFIFDRLRDSFAEEV
jgi:lipopolysaccharide transport system permease protein